MDLTLLKQSVSELSIPYFVNPLPYRVGPLGPTIFQR
jgi:hypothetical protein